MHQFAINNALKQVISGATRTSQNSDLIDQKGCPLGYPHLLSLIRERDRSKAAIDVLDPEKREYIIYM